MYHLREGVQHRSREEVEGLLDRVRVTPRKRTEDGRQLRSVLPVQLQRHAVGPQGKVGFLVLDLHAPSRFESTYCNVRGKPLFKRQQEGTMSGYGPSTYGDEMAGVYDAWYSGGDSGAAVGTLSRLSGGGPALELGIGTGRVALPLAAAGVEVHGIDASKAMVERLRVKAGAADIRVTVGDFTEVPVDGRFRLVFVVFNTLFALATQDDQVRCFQNVARVLEPGGRFVLECFVPDLGRFDRGQRLAVAAIDEAGVRLEASLHDPVGQRVRARIVSITDAGTRSYPLEARYCWPAELDLMARIAGLRLAERWGGWRGEPFTAASSGHVTVYEKPA